LKADHDDSFAEAYSRDNDLMFKLRPLPEPSSR